MDDDISSATVWKWFWIFVGFAVAVVVACWALGVFTSGVRGKAGVIEKNNDSNNQIEAQHTFNALWGDILSYKVKITDAEAILAKTPGDSFETQVLTGLKSSCSDAVQQFNADANDTTMKEWRPSSLPKTINPNDYCEVKP